MTSASDEFILSQYNFEYFPSPQYSSSNVHPNLHVLGHKGSVRRLLGSNWHSLYASFSTYLRKWASARVQSKSTVSLVPHVHLILNPFAASISVCDLRVAVLVIDLAITHAPHSSKVIVWDASFSICCYAQLSCPEYRPCACLPIFHKGSKWFLLWLSHVLYCE